MRILGLSRELGKWHWVLCVSILLNFATLLTAQAEEQEAPKVDVPLATPEEVAEAERVFDEWIAAYQAKDFKKQWQLTHPRIRTYHDKKRFRDQMKKSQRRGGKLIGLKKNVVQAIPVESIPCTEMGHCYRRGMQTVVIIVTTEFSKPPTPMEEYAIMTNSDEGWRWGGGTVLKLPQGETATILDRRDENMVRTRVKQSTGQY